MKNIVTLAFILAAVYFLSWLMNVDYYKALLLVNTGMVVDILTED